MESVGYWDRVRFGADDELKRRIRKVFGEENVVDVLTGPLSFTRRSNDSLTESENSGIYVPMGARGEYHRSYKRFHDTANVDELRYDFLPDKRPFAAPEPMWPTREASENGRRHFDVIVASDFRFPGGTSASNAEEIKAHKRMGLRTGLMQVSRYYAGFKVGLNAKVTDLIDGDSVQMLVYGEKVSCDTLILRHPSAVQEWQRFVPDVEAKDVRVIMNQTPMRDYGEEGLVSYTIGRCEEHVRRHFGKPGVWHPVGPLVRNALHRHHEEESAGITLADEDWPNIIDVSEWRRESRPSKGPRPRIGRHSRDAPVKWPVERDELLAVYPDSDDYEVHVLGGAVTPKRVLGRLPKNWRVLEFGEMHPKDFLSTLDVFVYYTYPDLVEAFGRTIVEAMAVGVPVILPPVFREVFGEAAIYAEPSEVKENIDKLMSDDEYYESRVKLARDHVDKHFGYTKHAERLGKTDSRPEREASVGGSS
jgi:hypothetical protein